MISLGKTLLLTSTLTFVCAVVNAAQKNTTHLDEQYIQQHGYMLFIPNLESEGKNTLQLETKKIVYSQKHSLLPKALPKTTSKKVMYKSCPSKKKNELYELSAIFNDKLQMFLSYIDDSKRYSIVEKKNNKNDINVNNNVLIH